MKSAARKTPDNGPVDRSGHAEKNEEQAIDHTDEHPETPGEQTVAFRPIRDTDPSDGGRSGGGQGGATGSAVTAAGHTRPEWDTGDSWDGFTVRPATPAGGSAADTGDRWDAFAAKDTSGSEVTGAGEPDRPGIGDRTAWATPGWDAFAAQQPRRTSPLGGHPGTPRAAGPPEPPRAPAPSAPESAEPKSPGSERPVPGSPVPGSPVSGSSAAGAPAGESSVWDASAREILIRQTPGGEPPVWDAPARNTSATDGSAEEAPERGGSLWDAASTRKRPEDSAEWDAFAPRPASSAVRDGVAAPGAADVPDPAEVVSAGFAAVAEDVPGWDAFGAVRSSDPARASAPADAPHAIDESVAEEPASGEEAASGENTGSEIVGMPDTPAEPGAPADSGVGAVPTDPEGDHGDAAEGALIESTSEATIGDDAEPAVSTVDGAPHDPGTEPPARADHPQDAELPDDAAQASAVEEIGYAAGAEHVVSAGGAAVHEGNPDEGAEPTPGDSGDSGESGTTGTDLTGIDVSGTDAIGADTREPDAEGVEPHDFGSADVFDAPDVLRDVERPEEGGRFGTDGWTGQVEDTEVPPDTEAVQEIDVALVAAEPGNVDDTEDVEWREAIEEPGAPTDLQETAEGPDDLSDDERAGHTERAGSTETTESTENSGYDPHTEYAEDEPEEAPEGRVRAVPLPDPVSAALTESLDQLRVAVEDLHFGLDVPGAEEARKAQAAVLAQLEDYVIPRVHMSTAPALIVIAGSTGAGKSTLVNTLAAQRVSATGVRRPTTGTPVLVCHPDDHEWFAEGDLLGGLTRLDRPAKGAGVDSIVLSTTERLPPGVALLDTPDIDSVVEEHHEIAHRMLDAADLWVFVTTASRYADAPSWNLLRLAKERGARLVIVLSRVPAKSRDVIVKHFGRMLDEYGLADAVRFVINETAVTDGRLPDKEVTELRMWLADLSVDDERRAAAVKATLNGVLDSFRTRVPALARHLETQVALRADLRSDVDAAYMGALADIDEATRNGSLLRGEVLARWQDFAGSGDLIRTLQLRRGGKGNPRGPQRLRALREAIRTALESMINSAGQRAAEEVVARWRQRAGAGDRLALTPGLGRSSDDAVQRTSHAIGAWQDHVTELIRTEGVTKRSVARLVSFDVESLALIFTVGLLGYGTTDVSSGPGTGALPQRLLRGLLGAESLRSISAKARSDLRARIGMVFDEETLRYVDALDGAGIPDEAAATRLYQATYNLEVAR